MSKRTKIWMSLFAALALPLTRADATVFLQFNDNPDNVVGGAVQIIQATPGSTVVISLQLVSTTETSFTLDYWFSQFTGPQAGVFSLVGRDFTGSDFPNTVGNGIILSPADNYNNSNGQSGFPDGVPDNQVNPRNGPIISGRASLPNPPGSHQVATFTLSLSPTAMPVVYELQTFDYPGFGWGDPNFQDHNFDNQAAIRIEIVPEPDIWALLGLGLALVLVVIRARPVGTL